MTTGGDRFAAIDLGATSGRVIVGEVDGDSVTATECSRFNNRPVRVAGLMQWDVLSLWADAVDGLQRAAREYPGIRSVAVDTWGVDYGLTRAGRLLGNPAHYRDTRTEDVLDRVHAPGPAG
ncbi:MAG: rhamnulokinase, partial [Microbacterium gubbeenense]